MDEMIRYEIENRKMRCQLESLKNEIKELKHTEGD